ncbi:hypothetical protein Aca07nite_73430 [Actinoplanes capillaceus]|uniref:HTH hxlR-type domain-containing protein n=1 Tax=Actinoplanes campanulatus TaxID=113559 RepID=A0ABQ3WUT2_9ACTN|nr:winged helix-turn-helix transcriptional regulator [Actinoplanes capillaceus]GID50068.1 hypothetical protein Aca07nite_73430 [Actinoplanes capillaceus]
MFRFRWDPPILAVLAEKPFRFRALHAQLVAHVGEHVDDNALTRSLQRLTRSGLVQADSQQSGNRQINTYRLSDKGRVRLVAYEAMVTVYAHINLSPDECDGRCSVHRERDGEHGTRLTDGMYVHNCR